MDLKVFKRARLILLPCFAMGLGSVALLAGLCINAPTYVAASYAPDFKPLPVAARPAPVPVPAEVVAPPPLVEMAVARPPARPVAESYPTMTERERRYWPMVLQTARDEGLDPALVMAVIRVESRFNPVAVSHRGAMGLMQIVPGTAGEMGLDKPLDAESNLKAGVRYLARLKRFFSGDIILTLAAYNAGPTKVANLGCIPDHPETQNYVVAVLSLMDYYRQRYLSLASK